MLLSEWQSEKLFLYGVLISVHLLHNHISSKVYIYLNYKFININLLFSHFQSVTVHTDVGDVKIELFCEYCPKACEVR